MIGKFVKSNNIKGVVDNVYRNVFNFQIEITINDAKFVLREPDTIIKNENTIMFIYGDKKDDISDDDFFEMLRDLSFHGHGTDEAFSMIKKNSRIVCFYLSDPPVRKTIRYRRKKKI